MDVQVVDVSQRMQAYLQVNRQGKLHPAQWRELVTEPVVMLMLVMVPVIILLRSLLVTLFIGGLWLVGLAVIAVFVFVLARRARRYARIPIYSATMTAEENQHSMLKFWKRYHFKDEDGASVYFRKNLMPEGRQIRSRVTYLVYYMQENDQKVLLSCAPLDHPRISYWKPTPDFVNRQRQRKTP